MLVWESWTQTDLRRISLSALRPTRTAMDDWQDDDVDEPTWNDVPSVLELGHRRIRIGNLWISPYDYPGCLDCEVHDCVWCPLFAPSACPLLNIPFYLQNLQTALARSPMRQDAARLQRTALRAALQIELRTHGRPLHFAVLARMVADRYPNLKVSPGRVSYMPVSQPQYLRANVAGVYRIRHSDVNSRNWCQQAAGFREIR